MNFYKMFHDFLVAEMYNLAKAKNLEDVDFSKVTVEPPKDLKHGDFSTNAAMVLCKAFGDNPRHLAGDVQHILEKHEAVERIDIAGPGFVNARLKMSFWHDQLHLILASGKTYGDSMMGSGKSVNVEYVSVNPTGPMHAGHGRGAIIGDVLANVYEKAGFDVTREYYINDEGGQADVLARSVYLRYVEALGGEKAHIPEGLYPGSYLVPVGQALAEKYGQAYLGKDETSWLDVFKRFAVEAMMVLIKKDLNLVGIHHEVFSSERKIVEDGGVERALKVLDEQGLLYEGVLEPPKGMKPDDWEPRPQLLFKATEFGDDVDRPLKKSDGSWTYFAKDIAYHYDKYCRTGPAMVNVWGSDHGGYVKRLQAAVRAVTKGKARMDAILCSMVNLLDKGQPVKMSKRSGNFVTLADVVDRVGKDVMRLIMLSRKNDAPLDFDFSKVTDTSHDNPVFYIQYAYARACSVFRQAEESLGKKALALEDADGRLLSSPAEKDLLKKITQWPRLLEQAAIHEEPHRVVYFLHEVASLFHSLWNKGKENTTLRFIREDDRHHTLARLMLVKAMQHVLRSGLEVCGVQLHEKM